MRRFHDDLTVMRSRVRFARRVFHLDDPPLYPVAENYARWQKENENFGRWRKRKPLDCGRPRCFSCHSEKFYVPKARANKKRAAIEFELRAG